MDVSITPTLFVVSDSAGETGELVAKAAAVQFSPVPVMIRRTPYIQDRMGIDQTVRAAKSINAVIVFTLVIPELRDYLLEQAALHQVTCIDLLGPIIQSLENVLQQKSRHEPGMIHALNEDYFKRVEAIEFAVKYDDGRDSSGVLKADIVLVGVSRTSKTPLSMYLAHKGYKVANVPLVPELKPPAELFAVSRNKIVGLKINTDKLGGIRMERLKALGLASTANYAKTERIEQELAYSDQIMKRLGCEVIDVSTRAVEETASLIQNMFRPL
ncbi:pyruvate, water dikinase regulatory protein [Paenibacillus aurantius]|uniref:Putative pyruvate, phosphate dikinase regulatory protein n=1 Tax=Paenibacillus aurantius TaxID=2918900 RepID=A0AA96LHL8_9BACL|nr:pyruvate, water dikinase regulatory protein [Paenibacillus aurantius]WJH37453.1 kinase/pyrophosphorylase [Paenibacillus sp. CC-CFT747]WNQ13470.1 pyruvate, water dikinase regulatory protein [Paenibacillus aurantius]